MKRKTLFGLVAAVVLLALVGWPTAHAHLQAMMVLREVANQPVPTLLALVAATPVITQDVTFAVPSANGPQRIRARLYLPKNQPNAPGMVVLHGVHHLGIDEPRMTGFANALASCGIRVLTPELPGIKDYHIGQESVEAIGESAKWFAAQTGAPVSVLGLSFSGGLALVAAADQRYHDAFKFVFAVGSQYAMDHVAAYYTSDRDPRPDGSVEILPAHEYGPLVLEYEHLEDFVPPADLEPVRSVLRAHLYEDKAAEAQASLGLNEVQKREVLALIDATSSQTRASIDAMVAHHVAEIPAISPRNRLRTLTTPVYLLHGEADNIIPSAETLWMATELPSHELKAVLISPVVSHIDLDGPRPGALDEWRLIHLFGLVIHAAESR